MRDNEMQADRLAGVRAWLVDNVPKLFLALGRVFALVWPMTSRHARDFSHAPAIPDGDPDDFVPVAEVRDPDEDIVFRDLMLAFAADCLAHDRNAGRKPEHEDQHWGNTTGNLEGRLEITDVGTLPKACRVGLFQAPETYPVVARPNFLREDTRIQVSRLSLKIRTEFDVPNVYTLEGKARELDLLLSEGLRQADTPTGDQDGQGFFFRDARQLRYMHWFNTHGALGLPTLLNKASGEVFVGQQAIMAAAVDRLYTPEQSRKNWAEKDYYSAGPYRLGRYLVKFGLRTRQESGAAQRVPSGQGLPHDQRAWFSDWQADGADAVFDLCVQIARFGAIPAPDKARGDPCKAVMASEYTDLVWNEGVSEFMKVGTLTLGPTAAPTTERPWYFSGRDRWYAEDRLGMYALRFNAWNTLPEMAPVGQLFRARKQVHAFHRETRLRHSFSAPTNSKAFCPMH
jgi:hypothetical protein